MNRLCRKTIIAGNWKMNHTASDVKPFMDALLPALQTQNGVEAALCVAFPLLPAMLTAAGQAVAVGAQDVSEFVGGAYTGQVSAAMLRDLGVQYCIIGHSERRTGFAESDTQINRKLRALLQAGIAPILCVGESEEQRGMELTREHIAYQVKAAFYDVPAEQLSRVVIAYEPLWAIGTGHTATSAQAQEVCAHIRAVLGGMYGTESAERVSILYGGSMNVQNAAELLAQPDIDGGLIGGASLKPTDFAAIVRTACHG